MPVPHYIQENKKTMVPNRYVCLDTESWRNVNANGGERHTWRLAVTSYDHRRTAAHGWAPTQWEYHETAEHLWRYVDGRVRQHGRTIVFAHNMGYDVRISSGLAFLPDLGWTVERWQVNDRGLVIRWRRGPQALWLVDTTGWWPTSLERIAGMLGKRKLALPDDGAPTEEWWRRCIYDVEILRAAVADMFAWVEGDGLGNWQPTPGAMAWAEWRHRHYTHKVLVHDNEDARGNEREAAYTGRCEAWRWGRLHGGPWHEYDMPFCYARIVRDLGVPSVLRWHVSRPGLRTVCRDNGKDLYLVRATVHQDQPVLPHREEGVIRWPVGQVSGWYWGVELDAARQAGATIEIHEGWRYGQTPALKAWAEWVIDYARGDNETTPELRRYAAKVWSRALIGKFASRYTVYERAGGALDDEIALDDIVDLDTGGVGKLLQLGGETFIGLDQRDGSETVPAIMSYVMAVARVRLWWLMGCAGLGNVAYCDTDGLIVNAEGAARLSAAVERGDGWGVREKSRHTSMVVHGPRQLQVDGGARMAGMPGRFEQVAPTVWVGEMFESLQGAITNGRPGEVVVYRRTYTPSGLDSRRLHLAGGLTAAYGSDGELAVAPGETAPEVREQVGRLGACLAP